MDRLLLRVPEAARMTGLSKSYLYRLVLSGEIPHIRFGRAVRIPLDDLQRWIAARIECAEERITA